MIHELAIIDPSAKIAEGVEVGPWSVIGPNVEIGAGTWIGSHVVIKCNTRIGINNRIYSFASVGDDPQDLKYSGEDAYLEIGDHNIIREYCTLNRGTADGGGLTKIGDHNALMAYTHVAHDCIIENHTVLANNATLSGHVTVGDYARISGFAGIHQFVQIGAHSFIAKASMISKDVLPFILVDGNPPKSYGLNRVGLQRRNFSEEAMRALKQAYRIVFRSKLTVAEALENMKDLVAAFPEVAHFAKALEASNRGIIR